MVTYPSDWDVVELGSKCNITSSKRVFEREWKNSGIPFLRTRDIASFHSGEEQTDKLYISEETYQEKIASSGEPHKGDLLVTGVGTIGLPYLIDTDDRIYFKDGNILWIKKGGAFFPQWLYLQFLSKEIRKQIIDGSGFTTVGTLTIKNAKKLKVPMPSVSEQTAIAKTLSTFDTYIDDLAELIEKKRNIRDGVLEDLISGRTRVTGYNSEWKAQKLCDLAYILNGDRGVNYPNENQFVPFGIPFVNAGHLENGRVNWDNMNYISKDRYNLLGGGKIKKGDILFCLRGSLGKYALVDFSGGSPASSLCIIRSKENAVQSFLSYIMASSLMRDSIEMTNTGSSQPNLSAKDISYYTFRVPMDINEQNEIANILTNMDEEIEALEIERDKMIQIKEGAMDDLLTGRIRLKV